MRLLRALIVFGVATLLVSCTSSLPPLISYARFTPPIAERFELGTNTVAVYGRFQRVPDFAMGNQIALRLRNETDKRDYLIQLREDAPVYAIAVTPGLYRVTGFITTFVDRRTAGGRAFRDTPVFEVHSNAITYLGDFSGFARIEPLAQTWGINGLTNDFAATTAELQQKFPPLASISTLSVFDQFPK